MASVITLFIVFRKGLKMYKCPKCSSKNTSKERINGSDTGDRICKDCGHITSSNSFKQSNNDRVIGATTGGAILGASLGGPFGLLLGGVIGALMGSAVTESKDEDSDNG
ncbi:TFIIB-type zinc ribbon-containing protein [Photobacterium sanguinicancri]|uniref:TFIIB-type zinc ribbon-containing protein n=1 Tax=Photobacterium sanguinicancri TaxID=875932 RepID=UPI003D0A3739